ncbi:MAG: sodium:calcium antiporter [Candidatus Bathyarchaeota archaeon]|nr:MAG: sodium:calcium antiporter [Candidatus Bathyarchaeota archaeon]
MTFEVIVALAGFAAGIALMVFASQRAGEHSISLAETLGASPFIIGLLLVSIGTDLPEIANSITSSALGHGNINVGNSLGSVLAQMTLVLGIISFFGGTLGSDRREIVIVGASEVLALFLLVSMTQKGYISRLDGLFLISSWLIIMMTSRYVTKCYTELHECRLEERENLAEALTKESSVKSKKGSARRKLRHLAFAILGFAGVAVGAYVVVTSVIALSTFFSVPEFLISFFVLGVGTSLPELVVDLWAIKRKYYDLIIGDVIGSSIVDATLSIGIGPLIAPITIWGSASTTTGVYAIIASIMVTLVLSLRMKLDKKGGVFLLLLYASSYLTILIV